MPKSRIKGWFRSVQESAEAVADKSDDKSVVASTRAADENADSKTRTTRQRIRPETRAQMLERLTNPLISLHEASVVLGVCSATVRRLCNAGDLKHERTPGGQRRFRLHDVLALHEARKKPPRK